MEQSDIDRIANECFRKGTEALNKGNWDYSVDMFGRASTLKPGNLVYRQTKHGALRKKYNDNGSGARMAGMKLMSVKTKIKKSRLKKDWESLDKLAEDGLSINPWDAQLFAELGESCEHRELEEVAVYAYSRAVEYSPDNIDYNRKLGHMLVARNEFTPARACFARIYKLDPTDGEARRMMGECDAKNLIERQGVGDAETTQDVRKELNAYELDRQARKAGMEQRADGPGQSEEADLQRAVRKEPDDINNYLKLADYYRNKKKYKEAIETYSAGLEKIGEDANVREQLEDVELDLLRVQAADAKDAFRQDTDNGTAKEKSDKLARTLLKQEIDVLSGRIERYPNDLRLKFELAQRYKRAGRPTQAIPLFQQASADTRIREEVLVGLGECFVKDKKLDLARRQFEKAIDTLNGQDKPELYKSAHYWLGRLYEKSGKTDKADHHYTEILAVDYEYKDVLKRLEKIQADEALD